MVEGISTCDNDTTDQSRAWFWVRSAGKQMTSQCFEGYIRILVGIYTIVAACIILLLLFIIPELQEPGKAQ